MEQDDQTAQRAPAVSSDGLTVGSEVTYLYKGPWGFAIQPERFKATVLSFTPRGRVRINAYDHVQKKWFKTTVMRRSLVGSDVAREADPVQRTPSGSVDVRGATPANVESATYRGQIVAMVPGYVYQSIGKGVVKSHEQSRLNEPVHVGETIVVTYRAGRATVSSAREDAKTIAQRSLC